MKVKAGFIWFILSTTIETFVHLWLHIGRGEVPRSTFKVKVQCLHDDAVIFADVWSIPAYDQFIAHDF